MPWTGQVLPASWAGSELAWAFLRAVAWAICSQFAAFVFRLVRSTAPFSETLCCSASDQKGRRSRSDERIAKPCQSAVGKADAALKSTMLPDWSSTLCNLYYLKRYCRLHDNACRRKAWRRIATEKKRLLSESRIHRTAPGLPLSHKPEKPKRGEPPAKLLRTRSAIWLTQRRRIVDIMKIMRSSS